MKYDRIVLGYHGCSRSTASSLLDGDAFRASANDYDWLGPGVYFWEYGPARALDFAHSRYDDPCVVGAIIQLANCFDLMDVRHTQELKLGYESLKSLNVQLPINGGRNGKARRLDCAVVGYTLQAALPNEYHSVRAPFIEGAPVYPGAGIHDQSHVQICVRNPACIIGVFRPTL